MDPTSDGIGEICFRKIFELFDKIILLHYEYPIQYSGLCEGVCRSKQTARARRIRRELIMR